MWFDGFDDFTGTAEEIAAALQGSADEQRDYWVWHTDGVAHGALALACPLSDNLHLLDMDALVDPGLTDFQPLLAEMWQVTREHADTMNRTYIHLWHDQQGSALDRYPTVSPASGGLVALDPELSWYRDHGFTIDQVEQRSTLTVADAPASAEPVDPAYEVITWTGATPAKLRAAMAPLRAAMSTDIPLGELDLQPEVWDAERVVREDQHTIDRGRDMVWAAARHRDSGEMAAYSYVVIGGSHPDCAYQADTLVRRHHRGHGLGLAVKQAVIEQLRTSRPAVMRIHTWNADENAHMLAINTRLGFRPSAVGAALSWRAE